MRARGSLLLIALACAGGWACSDEDPACFEGEYQRCACGDDLGYQRCESGAYAACDCESGTPGITSDGGGGASPLAPLYDPCESNADCDSGLCESFTGSGMLCTQTCSGDEDCPAPSPGCSMMGVCRVP